ncbi:MAG: hypothetical protein Q7T65_08280 [Thiobacillus sp.]|nr:hypothetical protein [Thiobacillus sp.]
MEKVRARHRGHKNIYVHNDLSNAAHHFMEAISAKLASGDHKGITFDYMACLISLAFTFEARINFLGHKLVKGWKERQPFNDKIEEVLVTLKVIPDFQVRPYSSIEMLKTFRDTLAHGKPVEVQFDEEVVLPADAIDRRIDLDGEWAAYCEHENVFNAHADIDAIWKNLLQLGRLDLYETITHGSSGLTFIEKFVDAKT